MTNSKQTEALREARQPAPATELREQEPVAYAVYHRMGGSKSLHWTEQHSDDGDHNQYLLVPLYTSPPAQRTWVNATTWRGLTDEEIDQGLLRSDYAFKTAEAWRAGVVFAMTKLKEKNCG